MIRTKATEQYPFMRLVAYPARQRCQPIGRHSELEAEIDRLCYNLYGLTDEEIAVVEGGRAVRKKP